MDRFESAKAIYAAMGVDVEAVLMAKHEYNKGREYRHGGKRA